MLDQITNEQLQELSEEASKKYYTWNGEALCTIYDMIEYIMEYVRNGLWNIDGVIRIEVNPVKNRIEWQGELRDCLWEAVKVILESD